MLGLALLSDALAIVDPWRSPLLQCSTSSRAVGNPSLPSRALNPHAQNRRSYGSLTPAQLDQLARLLLRLLAADRRLRRVASRHAEELV